MKKQTLEKKFSNWLMLNYYVPIKPEKIAHDLAEIAKKDYEEKEEEYLEEITGRDGIINKVIDERDKFKKQIEKWKSGENISRAAIDLFVHDYNEYCIEENRKDYMIRDEDVEGFFDSLDPLGDDNENK